MGEAEARNWAHLPPDLLHLIYTKLPPDIRYYVIFRSVCKKWRDSLNESPPKFPWLLQCKRDRHFGDGRYCLQQNLRYYSLATGETGTICVPKPFQGKNFHGPGHGYLLVSSCQKLSLLNPLTVTGAVISLPPLDHDFKAIYPVCDGSDPIRNWGIVSGFPSRSRIWEWRSVIYHDTEKSWTYFDNVKCFTCFWNGRLYTTEERCCTEVFDAVSGEKSDVNDYIEPPEEEDDQVVGTYLVESCQEILRVSRFLDFADEKAEGTVFHIYKLLKCEEGEGQQRRWVKASDIGDRVVFLDVMSGFSVMAPAGLKGNCIYFLDIGDGRKPYRFDIGTSTVEKVPCPFDSCTWFIPCLG